LLLRASTSGLIHPDELRDLMRDMDAEEYAQEYECSFDSALKGAIYADQVNLLFAEGRAFNAEGDPQHTLYDPSLPTHFAYDIGFTDAMVRIAWQTAPANHPYPGLNVVNVEAATQADIDYHIDSLHQFASSTRQHGGIGDVYLPHDARAKNLQTGKSILEQFMKGGIRPRIVPNHKVRDRIAANPQLFPTIRIDCTPLASIPDQSVTGDLLEALKAYRREWNDQHMIF